MTKKGVIFVVTIFMSLFLANQAFAIPVFARKYRTSCTTCHSGFMKNTPFGEAFRQNGYQIPGGDAAYVKEEPVKLGAEGWKQVWPNTVWPGTIPYEVPIAFYAHQRIFVTENTNPTTNFKFPHEFKIFAAGVLGDNFSFWVEHNLQGSSLNRIFAQLNDMFLTDSWGPVGFLPEDALNLKIGRIDLATLAFPLNTRRTVNKPLPYTYAVADSWDFSDLQSGFEANGVVRSRFKYAVGIVNGTGGGTPSGIEDENDEKDPYYRVAYKIGGLSFDGKDWGQEENLKETDNWIDNAVTIGQFGYFGTSTIGSGTSAFENDFRRIGFDLRFNFADLDLYGAYVRGRDKTPTSTIRNLDSSSWFAEADYIFYPWLQGAARYEETNYEQSFSREVENVVLSLLMWPRANIKVTLEGLFYPNDDGNNQFLADLTYAF